MYNTIGDDGAAALAEALKSNTALKYLAVDGLHQRGFFFGDDGAAALAEALERFAAWAGHVSEVPQRRGLRVCVQVTQPGAPPDAVLRKRHAWARRVLKAEEAEEDEGWAGRGQHRKKN